MSNNTLQSELDRDEWQTERMTELGIDQDDIVELLHFGFDWHDVARLVDHGCPPDLVAEILV